MIIINKGAFTSFIIIQVLSSLAKTAAEYEDGGMHPHFDSKSARISRRSLPRANEESSADHWIEKGQEAVKERVARKVNENVAKNVIMFLGDGMSIPTIAASRVYIGGESHQLSFEKFPYTGLSKTYCTDKQVADSACSATAYLGGVKANLGTIGVTAAVKRGDCPAMTNSSNYVWSIAHAAQLQGKMTGLVTTARVTHASPAGVYAHTADRDWESDNDVINANYDPVTCQDIATQLVYGATGRRLNVILGGGRSNFLPQNVTAEDGVKGNRLDGRDLIQKWIDHKLVKGLNPKYVSNKDQLLNLFSDSQHFNETKYLLGLFAASHMSYNLKRDTEKEPSLAEMTEAAIEVLDQSDDGYFLFVEGARIDMGHHAAQAQIALDETSEFSKAIQLAVDITDESETLIVVTSDHAHTLSYSGYAERGHDVLGIGGQASDKLPYATLNYANGPGYRNVDDNGHRHDISKDDMTNMDYRFPGIVPLESETHGGDDVAIFADGPWAHLFTGVMEENVLPHLMSYASCLGEGVTACDLRKEWWYQN